MKIKIKNLSGVILFETVLKECSQPTPSALLGAAVEVAVKEGVDLVGAYLDGVDLRGANLVGANLRDVCLDGANLRNTNLVGASLRYASLCSAYLKGANLHGANLRGSNLRYANLSGANLRGADLRGADLRGVLGIKGRVIDGGLRSDGYRFMLTRTEPGAWRVGAGCRSLSLTDARRYWQHTRGDTNLGHETFLILDHMEAIAKLREWPEQGEEQPHKRMKKEQNMIEKVARKKCLTSEDGGFVTPSHAITMELENLTALMEEAADTIECLEAERDAAKAELVGWKEYAAMWKFNSEAAEQRCDELESDLKQLQVAHTAIAKATTP